MGAAVSITRLDLTASELRKAASGEKDSAAARRAILSATSYVLPLNCSRSTQSGAALLRPRRLRLHFSARRSPELPVVLDEAGGKLRQGPFGAEKTPAQPSSLRECQCVACGPPRPRGADRPPAWRFTAGPRAARFRASMAGRT